MLITPLHLSSIDGIGWGLYNGDGYPRTILLSAVFAWQLFKTNYAEAKKTRFNEVLGYR